MRTNCKGTKTVRSPLNNAEALVEAANRIVLALSLGRRRGKYAFQRNSSAMQLHSASTFPPRPSLKEVIPYSSAALRQDLERVRCAWEDAQANRERSAIYGYLSAVYGLVAWWAAEGREIDRACRALRSQRLEISDREGPFAAVVRCTADPEKADKRTRSKWSRVMRYAVAYKPNSEALDQFVKRKGGINACAARFGRCLEPFHRNKGRA
jgi:hypothetical protein